MAAVMIGVNPHKAPLTAVVIGAAEEELGAPDLAPDGAGEGDEGEDVVAGLRPGAPPRRAA